MTDFSDAICLLLFFVSSSFYLFYWIEYQSANVSSVVFKCLPIISLCLFVYCHQSGSDTQFARGVLWALVLSGFADGLYIYPRMWTGVLGTVLFGIAQIMYTVAFTFDPWRWDILCVSLNAWSAFVWYASMRSREIRSKLEIGAYAYLLVLFGMCWRVAAFSARAAEASCMCNAVGTAGLIGALSFALSDLIIVIHIIVAEIPNRTHWVMTTYYLAQLGLALTVYQSDYRCLLSDVKETFVQSNIKETLVQSDTTFITSP